MKLDPDEMRAAAWAPSLQLCPAGGAIGAPEPASTAAALTSASLTPPDPPRFAGPKHATLWAAQWTLPLLIASGLYVLGAHGSLDLGTFLGGTAASGVMAGASRFWLGLRRRALARSARKLALYSSRTLGERHEVTRRALEACDQLEAAEVVAGWDPMCLTRIEQSLQYTRELIERPDPGPPPLPAPVVPREAW